MTRGRRSATLLLAVAGWTVGIPVGVATTGGGAAAAAERVVQIGREGVRPQVLQVEPGDTVRFVNDDATFAYRARSTAGQWRFDSGPTALLDGDFTVPGALTRPGTYAYRVAQDAPYAGSVVVAGTAGAVAPSAAPPAAPTAAPPAAPTAAPPAAPTAAPVAAPAVRGPLPGAPGQRALGLAVPVAVVVLGEVVSLLLRFLLAVPVRPDRTARP